MKKAIIIIVAIILIVAAIGLFFLEKPLVDISQYENLKEPRITEMANQKVIEVELKGNPSETAGEAMKQLFSTFYKLKRYGNNISKPVPKARWIGDFNNQNDLIGKYAMQVSDSVEKLPPLKGSDIKLVTWEYGTVAEILHVGAYDNEHQTVVKLIKYIQDNGYQIIGEHEEVYLQGPDLLGMRKPKNYYTIIRYRVKQL